MSRLDDLYARYFTPLTRKLIAFGQTEADAEDIAQEASIALWKRLDTVDPKREWFWLVTTALNIARDRATRANREKHGGGRLTHIDDEHLGLKGEDPSAEDELLRKEAIEEFQTGFNALMRELPAETQQSIILRDRGLESKEIAPKVGLTDQAVRTRLSRALEKFRALVHGSRA